jgi:hypothetical protein
MVVFPFGKIFGLTQISGIHWLYVFALTLVPTIAREIGRWINIGQYYPNFRSQRA